VPSEKAPRPGPVLLYLLLALPATLILCFALVNFHAPDDPDHLQRAYTLLHGPLVPITPGGRSSGAMIDSGLTDYGAAQRPVVPLSQRPVTAGEAAAFRAAPSLRWSGEARFSEMPGAMSYFPVLYAPQALALEAGRLSGASVATSVLWARLANGLVAIALAALGLRLLPAGHSLVLVLLLLPRTLLQFASNSADPILYGLALIVIALGLQRARGLNPLVQGGLAAAAAFVAGAVRPPLAALAFTPALRAARQRQWAGLALLGAGVAAAALWTLALVGQVVDLRCGGEGGPIGARLAAFATEWPFLIGHSFVARGAFYFLSFVGHYGWGDGPRGLIDHPLPMWMYVSAAAVLVVALRNDVRTAAPIDRAERLSLVAGAAAAVLVTFLAMYVACRTPEATVIAGVQGRYFVPAMFAVAVAAGGLAPSARDRLVALFPVLLTGWASACVAAMAWQAQSLYGS
jgi:Predicted membrane protein (DUF2142)